ncbi:hypothetical protein NP233_g1595 [Leucocoprinus birnbaumii]|uniref:Uncharacterized protein n=1 Tax=Leucocoprinus birnbaumii TaxID=56174 RepID=A0AAD5W296_9AGAR|nr:hypothetical protein NP233_g1595 [Leucocoprinus birnbaumii]
MASEDISAVAHIKGNASDDIKRVLGNPAAFFRTFRTQDFNQQLFGDAISDRLVCTEISLYKKPEEPKKIEAKVVVEITVQEALNMYATGEVTPSVSQALNVVYHSPGGLGDKLRLVNTTLTLGGRAHSARTEIWNLTHHRLVASGTHIKMQPSAPPKHSL